MSKKVPDLWQKEFASPVTFKHPIILMHKTLQPKTMVSGDCCDEKPAVASNTPLHIPEFTQNKVYKERSAKMKLKSSG